MGTILVRTGKCLETQLGDWQCFLFGRKGVKILRESKKPFKHRRANNNQTNFCEKSMQISFEIRPRQSKEVDVKPSQL